MKFYLRAIFLLLSIFYFNSSFAFDQDCAAIKIDKRRLQCYDERSKQPVKNQISISQNKSTEQVIQALRALRKISSATGMGVSMRDYSQMVLDQISIVDDAVRSIPDGEVRSNIVRSRDAYVDARTLWGDMFTMQFVSIFIEKDKNIYSKYEINQNYLTKQNSKPYSKTLDMDMSVILVPIWQAAKSSLIQAELLSGT